MKVHLLLFLFFFLSLETTLAVVDVREKASVETTPVHFSEGETEINQDRTFKKFRKRKRTKKNRFKLFQFFKLRKVQRKKQDAKVDLVSVLSSIFGAIGILVLFAIPVLGFSFLVHSGFLGIFGLCRIKGNPEKWKGKLWAWLGILFGFIALLLAGLYLLLLITWRA